MNWRISDLAQRNIVTFLPTATIDFYLRWEQRLRTCTSEYPNHIKTGENIHIRHGWHFFLLTSWRKRVAEVLIFLVSWSWLCCVSTALVLFYLLHFLFLPLLPSSGIPGQETGRHTWVICGHLPIISYKRPCVATCQRQMIPCGVVYASTRTFVFVLWQLYCSSPVHSLLSVLPWERQLPDLAAVVFSFPSPWSFQHFLFAFYHSCFWTFCWVFNKLSLT